MRSLSLPICAAVIALSFAPLAHAAGDQQQVVNDAASAIEQMRTSGIAKSGVPGRAKAALIVPHAVRGALGIGAEGGEAVLVENKGGKWSAPAFYAAGGVSIGPQVGGEVTAAVLLIITDRALDRLLKPSNVTGGAQATLTAAHYNANRVAELGGADLVIWSKSEGRLPAPIWT